MLSLPILYEQAPVCPDNKYILGKPARVTRLGRQPRSCRYELCLGIILPLQILYEQPTCGIRIHVFLWRSLKNMNIVFRLANPVYAMDMYIFKANVFIKQENVVVFFYAFRALNM